MSTEMIAVMSVLGAGALIGLFYVSHSIEKQRRERALMIANLSDYTFRLQRLLDAIPDAYLSKDVQLLLLNQIKKRMVKLTALAPGNDKFRKKLDSTNAQITDVTGSTQNKTAPQLKSPAEANEIRMLLQELSKIIENFAQHKVVSAQEAKTYLVSIQNGFIEANIGYLIQVAQSARQEQKPKVAIMNYQKAIKDMQKRNGTGMYSEKIAYCENMIKELSIEADAPQATATDVPEGNELDQALDDMMQEEDAWKKKYF